ncbi:MAG: pentapeptide repeat-containing protein, partial [Acidobacteriota bacterium]|nr:pentapeptide repeat-containing protein [Acidobacteriota bacterium]
MSRPTVAERLMSRLSERAKPPRSWWFPHRNDPGLEALPADRIQQDFLDISSNIAKTLVTILAFSFFCVFTLLGAPDRELIAAGAQITIPVAKVGVSFAGFLVLGPLLLIAFFLHLHIFVSYWLSLKAVADNPRRGAYVFNLPFPSTRLLSSILFYWLVPIVIGVFAWKAAPQPVAGRLLFLTFIATTTWSLWTQIRRTGISLRQWNLPRWALVASAALALVSSSGMFRRPDLYSSIRSLRGGMRLQGADLAGHDLRDRFLESADLTDAVLQGADLNRASLSDAKLLRADLSGADLTDANLRRADLTDARLAAAISTDDDASTSETEEAIVTTIPTRLVGAILVEANLRGADLTAADLTAADMRNAHFGESQSGHSATLVRANLSRARLESANLRHADLRGAYLVQSKLRGAVLSGALLNASDDGTTTDLTEAMLMETDLSGA